MNNTTECISIIGAGSFGSAMTLVLANSSPKIHIKIWARRQEVTNEINQSRTNKQYLPKNSRKFPKNVVATSDIKVALSDSNIIFIAIPGEFIDNLLNDVNFNEKIVVSLVKSIKVSDRGDIITICELIKTRFPYSKVCVLTGPNMYDSLARGEFAEATIASEYSQVGTIVSKLFNRSFFKTDIIRDRVGAELAGVLKNIIALGTGFIDVYSGSNAIAALIRSGLHEMYQLSLKLRYTVSYEAFFESASGIGDLLLTTHSGRGILLSKTYAEEYDLKYFKDLEAPERWELLESRLFGNMKLPDWHTAYGVGKLLEIRGWFLEFPLLYRIYEIVWKDIHPQKIMEVLSVIKPKPIKRQYSLFTPS